MPPDSGRYAVQSKVDPDKSRLEIERALRKYGADQFLSGYGGNTAMIGFRVGNRQYRIQVPLPDPDSEAMLGWDSGAGGTIRRTRSVAQRDALYEQKVRTRWRALLLVVKATLEAIEVGIFTFEEAFVANTLMPNGETVGEWVEPQVDQVYATGEMPQSLPGLRPDRALTAGKP